MKSLTSEQVAAYHRDGYFAPVRALSVEQALAARNKLEAYEAQHGVLAGPIRNKSHLLFPWLNELVRAPAILDAVEDIFGTPNLWCWSTSFFTKEAHDPRYVSWHQDSTYWGLEPADILTAWVALSESTLENGAMRVIAGTHKTEQLPHKDTFAKDNLLSRGQEIMVDVDESRAVALELQPGEMSLHHVRLVHGSDPNPSAKRRIGFAIRYIPTTVRQVVGERDFATLVRGVDNYGHFEQEEIPAFDMAPAAVAHHERVMSLQTKTLYRGADAKPKWHVEANAT